MARMEGRGSGVSLRWQLSTVTLVTVLAVFGVGFGLLSTRDMAELRADDARESALVARLVGESSAGELAFASKDEAAAVLAYLSVDPEVESAALYDDDGQLFASYVRSGADPPPVALSTPLPPASAVVGKQEIVVHEEVGFKGERYGTVRLVTGNAAAVQQAREHRFAFLGMGALLLALAMGISGLLQRAVSGPVLALAGLAERISVRRDWSERAHVGGSLEIDALARGFNTLLAAIGQREAERDAAERAQRGYLERLKLLREVDHAILAAEPPERVAALVAERLSAMTGCASVGVVQRGHGEVLDRVLARSPPVEAPAGPPYLREAREAEPDCLLHVPLRAAGRRMGCLVCVPTPGSRFAPGDQELVQALADSLSVLLRQAELAGEVARHTVELEQRVADRTRELTATVEELEGFTYSVAHDLRAPLRAVHGYATLMLSESGHDGAGGDYLRRIVAAAQRMDRLIIDLLEYSRLSRGAIEVGPVPLESVVTDACSLLSASLQERGARLTVARPLATVLGSRTTLVQVAANLIDNATKFARPGAAPVVRVWTERLPGDAARLCVEDEGIGIPPEYVGDLFRVFHRLHPEASYPGTGIGLAIVKRAVERMGGSVGVSSEPGRGSRFWVDLPVPVAAEVPA